MLDNQLIRRDLDCFPSVSGTPLSGDGRACKTDRKLCREPRYRICSGLVEFPRVQRSMSQLVGYARVSTAEQSPTSQLDALKVAGCDRVFTETASGAQRNRPELHQALDYMRKGDVLVVWRLDRLARSVRQLVDTAADLHARGIEMRSLHDAIDTSTATGRLTFHLFAALAEFERDVIRDRTAIGLAAARARGRKGGRPRKLAQKDQDLARALLTEGSTPFAEVARRVRVAPSTLYGYFPGGRYGELPPDNQVARKSKA
jgi:DNA invertase Pin-like site-specific DNA recombinase